MGSQREGNVADAAGRRRDVALAGHLGDEARARAALDDPDPAVRGAALGALARMEKSNAADILALFADVSPPVRRRACEVAASADLVTVGAALVAALDDGDVSVAEVAAWAIGEQSVTPPDAVAALAKMATSHRDALCREAAVAALGAIGDEGGLAAILAATKDKPAVRRRAVLALAPFEGPDVDAALEAALSDRDWQVRQAAEDLRTSGPPP